MYITPCVSICRIEDKKCIGCGRTVDQITNWTKYSHEERMHIMKGLGYGKRTSKEDRLVRNETRRAQRSSREAGE